MTQYIKQVKALYCKKWSEAKDEAFEIISVEEASGIVRELTSLPGWRERVAAANIIAAFRLYPLAPALIKTFEENPENYTCSSFSLLVSELPNHEQDKYRRFMLGCCPEGSYGDHLRSIILRDEQNSI